MVARPFNLSIPSQSSVVRCLSRAAAPTGSWRYDTPRPPPPLPRTAVAVGTCSGAAQAEQSVTGPCRRFVDAKYGLVQPRSGEFCVSIQLCISLCASLVFVYNCVVNAV